MQTRLVILGGGQMGEALLTGLVAGGGVQLEELGVVEPRPERREELIAAHPGLRVMETPVTAEGVVVAVKPVDAEAACRSLRGLEVTRVLSIAAGVPLAVLEGWLEPGVRVLRAMSNTPALVGAAVSALAPGTQAHEGDLGWAEAVLGAVGTVVRLPEASLDAVTGLSGSGPAYLFLIVEALVDAGVAVGLSHDVSQTLVTQTVAGAARLLTESGASPATLRAAVTSPGGTSAAGLGVLEGRAVRGALLDAVSAATARSVELGHPGP
ncbi:MAG TPA: pyrroline-5-carboxylate reductase [Acidimicrobiales bacterium]|nr:pyrroline-5-carboxylate reductase [Acidimicrobiales bacterium]